jgi:proton-dependent oligopeptide transporter, POT family
MKLDGVPNDVLANLNPISIIILVPALDGLVYPVLRKMRIRFTPIKKITAGYFTACAAMIWTAVVQYYIYQRSECGQHASGKKADGTRCANADVNVWAQSGSYILTGLAEIFASITSLEYAYSKAPANMRSMVQAISLAMNAVSSALGFALVSLSAASSLVTNLRNSRALVSTTISLITC